MSAPKKENQLLSLLLNVAVPSVILAKFSGESQLGPVWGLVIALAFPVGYGLWDFARRREWNFFSLLGLFSVLLTGGFALAELPPAWIVAKETGVPLLIGLVLAISQLAGRSLPRRFFGTVLDLEKIQKEYSARKKTAVGRRHFLLAESAFTGSFFLSAIMNFVLASYLIRSQPGTEAFNAELAKLTALSLPVIALPLMLILTGTLIWLFAVIARETQLPLEDCLKK